jgi:hypothetical protein
MKSPRERKLALFMPKHFFGGLSQIRVESLGWLKGKEIVGLKLSAEVGLGRGDTLCSTANRGSRGTRRRQ